jgi:hypothetical protein
MAMEDDDDAKESLCSTLNKKEMRPQYSTPSGAKRVCMGPHTKAEFPSTNSQTFTPYLEASYQHPQNVP